MARTLTDFFIQEATEYLDRIVEALEDRGEDSIDRIRRLARALRGSARMTDQEAIAEAAGAVQALAADVIAGRRHFDAEAQGTLREALVQIRQMIETAHSPPEDQRSRARDLVDQLGRPATTIPPVGEGQRLRRYLGTELRGLATDLGEAIAVLERDPRNRQPLKNLLRRIRPLRGVQGIDQIPAVGPALAAVEEVILRIADTSATVGPGHLVLFRRARQALEDVATDLIRGDEPASVRVRRSEIEDLKERALDTAAQREITWISELFHDDPGPHIEECPMAEKGAGSWEAFFAIEATGSLDTADRLRTEMDRDPDASHQIGQRLAYTFRQLRERAVTFGHSDLGRVARRSGAAVRAALEAPPWRLQSLAGDLVVTIGALRSYLGAEDEDARQLALQRAEESLEAATYPVDDRTVLPIEMLLYSSEAALSRALELRAQLGHSLEGDNKDLDAALHLLTEVFGLIEHALTRSNSGR